MGYGLWPLGYRAMTKAKLFDKVKRGNSGQRVIPVFNMREDTEAYQSELRIYI